MSELPSMTEALSAELKKYGMTMNELADLINVRPSRLYAATGTSRPCIQTTLKLMKWMLLRDMDIPTIVGLGFVQKEKLPLGILENPESRYRLAKFFMRLWVEEQEEKYGYPVAGRWDLKREWEKK
ncbi:MAG: hypothetical protein ACI4SV_00100 [Duodenibacillus sp.]